MRIALIMWLVVVGCFSCKKKDPLGPQTINDSLFFVLKKNNQRLSDTVLNGTKLYYYQSNLKKYVDDFGRASEQGYSLGVQVTRNIGSTSGDNGIKNYYLEYPDGTQDTLFVDFRHVSYNEAAKNSCYCYYPLESVRYNGQVPTLDSSITQQKVYLFKKR